MRVVEHDLLLSCISSFSRDAVTKKPWGHTVATTKCNSFTVTSLGYKEYVRWTLNFTKYLLAFTFFFLSSWLTDVILPVLISYAGNCYNYEILICLFTVMLQSSIRWSSWESNNQENMFWSTAKTEKAKLAPKSWFRSSLPLSPLVVLRIDCTSSWSLLIFAY